MPWSFWVQPAEPGPPLRRPDVDEEELHRLETGFGRSLAHLAVDGSPGAAALAAGRDAYALGGDGRVLLGADLPRTGPVREAVLAHEAAHALGARSEPAAERAGAAARARMHGRGGSAPALGAAGGHGLGLHACSRSPSRAQQALDGRIAFTADIAREALTAYRGLSDTDRQAAVDRYYPSGAYQRLFAALPPDDASGPFNDEVQDILRRVQRIAVRASASASGLADEAAMATAQANLMQQRNLAAAQAATGSATPTPAQVSGQQTAQVAQTSIPAQASGLTPAQVAAANTATAAAVATLVSWAAVHQPGLRLSAADFSVDVAAVEDRGAGVIAFGSVVGTRNVAVVGRTFTRYVTANPAYALSVVVHELHGHPEYGPYGSTSPYSEYGLELYDRAAALMPGYTRPTGQGRTSEIDAYAYQETEIYSLLRSLPYHTPLAPADAALQPNYIDPEPTVLARIRIIQRQWEPRVAKALLRGMYERFRLDPRLTPAALDAFRRGVRAVFPPADATDILR